MTQRQWDRPDDDCAGARVSRRRPGDTGTDPVGSLKAWLLLGFGAVRCRPTAQDAGKSDRIKTSPAWHWLVGAGQRHFRPKPREMSRILPESSSARQAQVVTGGQRVAHDSETERLLAAARVPCGAIGPCAIGRHQ